MESQVISYQSDDVTNLILHELKSIRQEMKEGLLKLSQTIQSLAATTTCQNKITDLDASYNGDDAAKEIEGGNLPEPSSGANNVEEVESSFNESFETCAGSVSSDDTIDHNTVDLSDCFNDIRVPQLNSDNLTETNLMTLPVVCAERCNVTIERCDVTLEQAKQSNGESNSDQCQDQGIKESSEDDSETDDQDDSSRSSRSDRRMRSNHVAYLLPEDLDCQVNIVTNISTGQTFYECPFCSKLIKKRKDFNQHVGVHKGVKPFECMFCYKNFSRKGRMVEHMRTHTGDRPFKCTVCKRGFCSKNSLQCHMIAHKKKTPDVPALSKGNQQYMCVICDKMFAKKAKMASHMRVHAVF